MTIASHDFIDMGNAPELYADGLHDVTTIGSISIFILFVWKQTADGVIYKEPAFVCRMPNEAIGPAIALTLKKTSAGIIVPIVGSAARHLMMH